MQEIEKLKKDLKPFNTTYIAKKSGICRVTLANFKNNRYGLSVKSFLKVRETLDKIAKDILGINHD